MKKTWYIYKITNLVNNKQYIGQRLYNGDPLTDTMYMGSGTAIKAAIKKYGKENFTKEILLDHIADQDNANHLEQLFIERYSTLVPNGYNLTTGGKQQCIFSDETKSKMMGRKNWLGKHHTSETRLKMSDAGKGKNFSVGHRKKLSEALKGSNKNWLGKHHTNESKLKMSLIHKLIGEKRSNEIIKKLQDAVEFLKNSSFPITKKNLIKISGLSQSTINKYWKKTQLK